MLICGLIVYDFIMIFEGWFCEYILFDQVYFINLSFFVLMMCCEFGGCVGNIGYVLYLFGGDVCIMGMMGVLDVQLYFDWFDQFGLCCDYVCVLFDMYIVQVMIMIDFDNNQIVVFYLGVMMQLYLNYVGDVLDIKFVIVGLDGFDGMVQYVEEFVKVGVLFVFDLGQGLLLFDGVMLCCSIEFVIYVVVNDYEVKLVSDKMGWFEDEIVSWVDVFVIMCGEYGVIICYKQGVEQILVVLVECIVDLIGCGDVFWGGLLYGIEYGFDWVIIGCFVSLMGLFKIVY